MRCACSGQVIHLRHPTFRDTATRQGVEGGRGGAVVNKTCSPTQDRGRPCHVRETSTIIDHVLCLFHVSHEIKNHGTEGSRYTRGVCVEFQRWGQTTFEALISRDMCSLLISHSLLVGRPSKLQYCSREGTGGTRTHCRPASVFTSADNSVSSRPS